MIAIIIIIIMLRLGREQPFAHLALVEVVADVVFGLVLVGVEQALLLTSQVLLGRENLVEVDGAPLSRMLISHNALVEAMQTVLQLVVGLNASWWRLLLTFIFDIALICRVEVDQNSLLTTIVRQIWLLSTQHLIDLMVVLDDGLVSWPFGFLRDNLRTQLLAQHLDRSTGGR